MIHSIKIEIWKATHNFYFYMAFVLGTIIALLDVIQNAFSVAELYTSSIELGTIVNGIGYKMLNRWIAVNGSTIAFRFYVLLWPILASLPFSWSFHQELHCSIRNQYICRLGRKHYYLSKFIAIVLMGGFSTTWPLILDIFFISTFCPNLIPSIFEMQTTLSSGWYLSQIYYSKPLLFIILWTVTSFLQGSAVASIALLASSKVKNPVYIVLFPFLVIEGLDAIGNTALSLVNWPFEKSILMLGVAGTFSPSPAWMHWIIIVLFSSLSITLGYRRWVRNELI